MTLVEILVSVSILICILSIGLWANWNLYSQHISNIDTTTAEIKQEQTLFNAYIQE